MEAKRVNLTSKTNYFYRQILQGKMFAPEICEHPPRERLADGSLGGVLGPLWLYCKNDYRYTDKELEEWAVKVNEMAREAKALRIYFNNHYEGNAVYTENVPRSGRIGSKGKHADEGSG